MLPYTLHYTIYTEESELVRMRALAEGRERRGKIFGGSGMEVWEGREGGVWWWLVVRRRVVEVSGGEPCVMVSGGEACGES